MLFRLTVCATLLASCQQIPNTSFIPATRAAEVLCYNNETNERIHYGIYTDNQRTVLDFVTEFQKTASIDVKCFVVRL